MPMKNFNVVFESKKTQHPEGKVQREYLVCANTKGMAQIIARGRLEEEEPENVPYYKAPKAYLELEESAVEPMPMVEDCEEMEVAPDRSNPEPIEDAVFVEPEMLDEDALLIDVAVNVEPEILTEDAELTEVADPIIEPDPIPSDEEPEVAEKIVFENGTYDMPNHVYHASEGISSSMVKKACESMMLYQGLYVTKIIQQPKGDALRFGNLFHTLVLEPNKLEEEYIMLNDSIDRRTKAGREAYKFVMETAEAKHLIVVTQDEFALAHEMANRAVNDRYATKLLRSPVRQTEISIYKTHPTTGLQVKVRPDLIVGDVCIDLKSIHINRSVDSEWMLEHLRREVIKYKYHLSAAMYLEVAGLKEFVWVFVNKAPGYHWVATIRASEQMLSEGEDLYHTAMHRIHNATKDDVWPGPMSIVPTVQNTKIILPEV